MKHGPSSSKCERKVLGVIVIRLIVGGELNILVEVVVTECAKFRENVMLNRPGFCRDSTY
jgi:hypothetical protein